MVDDGLHTCVALAKKMRDYEAWVQAGSKESSGDAPDDIMWDQLLLDTLKDGLVVDWVQYPEEDRDVRVCWNTHVHDEDSNRYSPTSLWQKLQAAALHWRHNLFVTTRGLLGGFCLAAASAKLRGKHLRWCCYLINLASCYYLQNAELA